MDVAALMNRPYVVVYHSPVELVLHALAALGIHYQPKVSRIRGVDGIGGIPWDRLSQLWE